MKLSQCLAMILVLPLSMSVYAQTPDPDPSALLPAASQAAAGENPELPVQMDSAQSLMVAQLQQRLDKTSSLTANFDSVLLDADHQPMATSKGEVFIKRPGKFRWEYRAPSPSIVLADGVYLWSYDEELEQAIKRKLSDYRGANPTLLLGGGANVTDSFDVRGSYVTDDENNGQINWLELSPKDDTSDFVKVRLGFHDDVIHLMELFDRLDQTTRIQFTDVHTNDEVNDDLFVFVPPENVDVVGDD